MIYEIFEDSRFIYEFHIPRSVPTYGAILVNKKLTHCVLVQGSSEKSTWGFPKGKVNTKNII